MASTCIKKSIHNSKFYERKMRNNKNIMKNKQKFWYEIFPLIFVLGQTSIKEMVSVFSEM